MIDSIGEDFSMPTDSMCQLHRQSLFSNMDNISAVLFFFAQDFIRSADTEYPYRQNSYFWYLSQFNEPQAVLVFIKQSDKTQTILFNRPKNALLEVWTGRRLGQQAAIETLNVDQAFAYEELGVR